MQTFRYFMPANAYFGKDCMMTHKQAMAHLGKKAMLVTGRTSAKKNGAQKDMTTALDDLGIGWILFDEVGENPDLETVVRAANMAVENDVDFIVGIGGGSPMDAAKAIAVLVANKHADTDILFTDQSAKFLPVVEVPTTAGTGSEATQYAILTLHKKRTKNGIVQPVFAAVSYLDPKYMATLSPAVTNNTAVDAMSHLVESYLNTNANTMSEKMAEMGLSYWKDCIPALKSRQYTEQVREKLMLASFIGGVVIAQTSTSLPHAMGYLLTYEKGVPHGRANGMVMQGYLELFGKENEKIKRILYCLGLQSTEAFGDLMKEILDISETFTKDDITYYTERVMENPKKMKTFPLFDIAQKDIYHVYEKSLL